MTRMLVKAERVVITDREYLVRYFEARTPRGLRRYSAEVLLAPGDCVILDDDSMASLETRAAKLVPATLYCRTLLKTA